MGSTLSDLSCSLVQVPTIACDSFNDVILRVKNTSTISQNFYASVEFTIRQYNTNPGGGPVLIATYIYTVTQNVTLDPGFHHDHNLINTSTWDGSFAMHNASHCHIEVSAHFTDAWSNTRDIAIQSSPVYSLDAYPNYPALPDLTVQGAVASPPIPFSNPPGTTVSWTATGDIGFGTQGIGDIPSFTPPNWDDEIQVEVQYHYKSCVKQKTFFIHVSSVLTLIIPSIITACPNLPISIPVSSTIIDMWHVVWGTRHYIKSTLEDIMPPLSSGSYPIEVWGEYGGGYTTPHYNRTLTVLDEPRLTFTNPGLLTIYGSNPEFYIPYSAVGGGATFFRFEYPDGQQTGLLSGNQIVIPTSLFSIYDYPVMCKLYVYNYTCESLPYSIIVDYQP